MGKRRRMEGECGSKALAFGWEWQRGRGLKVQEDGWEDGGRIDIVQGQGSSEGDTGVDIQESIYTKGIAERMVGKCMEGLAVVAVVAVVVDVSVRSH